ncbi:MAG: response regulator receiver protein [Sulfurovum sp. AS07-7]|nr:MAG: response regulator receiver protein [Sulfurovum sp. AS07-7]
MGINVLVVDDDFINRKLLLTMLKKNDIVENIVEAENGQDALKKIESQKIDLILLDIIMPIMDGIEFLKTIKENRVHSNIPIAILSTDDSKKTETLNLGADAFLTKPIREAELRNLIDIWF